MPSRDARFSFDFGNDGVVRAECGRLRNFPGETGADDAFNYDRGAGGDLAARVMDGQPSADASARRRTINLAFGEDADIAAVMIRIRSRADEDHAVKKNQLFFDRWRDG